jgi:predicted GIY-YIG superfamily endonuclease
LHKNIGPLPTTLAYFFSAFANNESADAKSLARSLVLQLLQKGISSPNSECQPAIDELASFCLEFENGSQIPFYSLRSVIATAFKKMPRCSLIIDGLDECMDIANVRHLVEDFIDLDIEHRPKAIILSRQTEDLSEFMANSVAIVMDTKTIMPDIEQFISKKIAEYPDLDSIQEQIYAKIRQSQSSGGMFLWASQMMDCLMQPARTEEKQLRRLERIPEGLTNAFEQRVSQHGKGRKPSDLMLRREILLLLLASKRALMIGELEVALQFKTRYRQQKARRLNDVKGEVQDLCKPLVSVMEDRVAFIHSSVGDFLCTPEPAGVNLALSIHMTLKQSHSELASRCLNVLSEEQNRSPERIAYWLYKNVYADVPRHLHDLEAQANLNREIIFYEYAARYWDYHLTAVKDPTAALLNQLNEFLRNYEFVTWAEYLYNLKSEIAPVAEVLGDLKSWKVSLPVNKRDAVDLDAFFTRPYRRLSEYYAQNGEDHLLKYLCLYHLGDFYALQYDLDAEYDVKRDVASGFESILGNRNPLTLRAKYSFGMCYTVRGELTQALDLYLNISAIQKVVCGLHNPDYYQSLQQVAFLQFLMTRFEEANITQVEVSLGLSNIRGSKRRLVLESNIFDGYIHEALGLLETALALYQYVYKTQSGILGQNNPLALYAQICMASAYRKQHKYAEALENLEYAFQIRQQLWGLADPSVVDTAIQLIILYREMKRFDDANARIDLIMDEGQLENKFQRYCQVKHIQALVLIDQGEFETPRKILQSLLDRQGEKGREFNNRSLLWVRLTLATILKQHGKDDEVGMLFYGLVTPLQDGDISPQFERIESLGEMKIAELALRLIRERQRNEAESLLEENNLRWSRKEDFWLFEGGPSADTAWMEGP